MSCLIHQHILNFLIYINSSNSTYFCNKYIYIYKSYTQKKKKNENNAG